MMMVMLMREKQVKHVMNKTKRKKERERMMGRKDTEKMMTKNKKEKDSPPSSSSFIIILPSCLVCLCFSTKERVKHHQSSPVGCLSRFIFEKVLAQLD